MAALLLVAYNNITAGPGLQAVQHHRTTSIADHDSCDDSPMTVRLKSTGSWLTSATCSRSQCRLRVRMSRPSSSTYKSVAVDISTG